MGFAEILLEKIMADGAMAEIVEGLKKERPDWNETEFKQTDFNQKTDESKGVVPESSRAFYLLAVFYKRKLIEAMATEERMQYAALKAAAEVRWKIEYANLTEKISLFSGRYAVLTKDWQICVRVVRY